MASMFLVQDPSKPANRTFFNDDKLPSLPVPEINETISKYLSSCRAILSDEDYKKTKEVCQKFIKSDSAFLQKKLLQRAAKHRNWMEDWWLNKVYLETRTPMPLQNFSGPGTYLESVWPLKDGTQLERTALGNYAFLTFWDLVRKEMLAPHVSDGKYLTMNQFRYLFNTCRIPQKGRDRLLHCFQTETEGGNSPTNIIVLCKGYIFHFDAINPKTGNLLKPPQLYSVFKKVVTICELRQEPGPGVPALTGLSRDSWAEAREHLLSISENNVKALNAIENSMYVTALDATSPRNYTEISLDAMFGDADLRWYDKSYVSVCAQNGAFSCNCDHTPYDAMVIVALVEYITNAVQQVNGVWPGPLESADFPEPIELKFDLDEKSLQKISRAKQQIRDMRQNIELLQLVFCKFGKAALKKVNLHPDFIIQLCFQLAYMHVHGVPGPAYETAMTRQFYHGRTETCRTCTPEAVAFCRAMLNNPIPGTEEHKQLIPLLRQSHSAFLALMKDCTFNRGCDRHLLGLLLICVENDLPIPELYTDPAFTATGGNGNFVISSSCVGYLRGQGAVAPMVENGYGFFYRINDEKIIYSVSSYNSCPETSAQQMSDCFQFYLSAVLHIAKSQDADSKL